MHFKTLLAIAIFSTAANTSTAQTSSNIGTIKNDRQRIKQGVRSGELTKPETARLAAQTIKLKNEREAYKAVGVITTAERKDYRKDKKRVSRNIYHQKHDRQRRP